MAYILLSIKTKGFFFVKAYEQKLSSFLPVPIEVIPLQSRRITRINTELWPEALSRASKVQVFLPKYLKTAPPLHSVK